MSAGNIFEINADGSGIVQLTHYSASAATIPVWSPDGSKIAFISNAALDGSDSKNTNGVFNIWVMNNDGSGATPLTNLTGLDTSSTLPAWSPAGNKIVFTSSRALDGSNAASTNGFNLWIIGADGSAPTPLTSLTDAQALSWEPSWSSNGSQIAFASNLALDGSDNLNTNGVFNIWTVNTDGSGLQPVTRYTAAKAGASQPVWHP